MFIRFEAVDEIWRMKNGSLRQLASKTLLQEMFVGFRLVGIDGIGLYTGTFSQQLH